MLPQQSAHSIARIFPRFQQAVAKPKLIKLPKAKRGGAAAETANAASAKQRRNNRDSKASSADSDDQSMEGSEDDESSSSDDEDESLLQRCPPVAPYIFASASDPVTIRGFAGAAVPPFAALSCEWERCLALVEFVIRRACVISLPTRPTVQSALTKLSDFALDQMCVVALPIRHSSLSRLGEDQFTMERCMIVSPQPNLPSLLAQHLVSVHLLHRSESDRRVYALTPIWYLYQPR